MKCCVRAVSLMHIDGLQMEAAKTMNNLDSVSSKSLMHSVSRQIPRLDVDKRLKPLLE